MRIYYNQLINTLKQQDPAIWLVFGDEPWQKNDSLSTIKTHLNQQGFDEVIRFSADDKFDWQQIIDEYQTMSLFASQRIIEIELMTHKVGDAGSKALINLSQKLHPETKLIFHGSKLDTSTSNKKWFKSLAQHACYLPLYDLDVNALAPWLKQQAKKLNLNLANEVIPLLIELFEGNLLALAQELQKMSILFGQQQIQLDELEKLIINQAKFNPFQLLDNLLSGNCQKCVAILEQQQQQGIAVGQLIWFIHKELQQLLTMFEQLQQGESMSALYKQYRIWDKRKPLYQHALTQSNINNVQDALARLSQVDLISKTTSEFDAFILLADVCLTLYQGQTMKQYSLDYLYV